MYFAIAFFLGVNLVLLGATYRVILGIDERLKVVSDRTRRLTSLNPDDG